MSVALSSMMGNVRERIGTANARARSAAIARTPSSGLRAIGDASSTSAA